MFSFISNKLGRQISYIVGLGVLIILTSGFVLFYLIGMDLREDWTIFSTRVPSIIVLAVIVCLSMLAATVWLNMFLIKRMLTIPLDRLASIMKSAENGNFLVRANTEGNNEFNRIARIFNGMLATITDLHASQLENERELVTVQQELKYKDEIEAKRKQLEEANQSMEKIVNELILLFEVAKTVNSTLELDDILGSITELLGQVMGYKQFSVLLMNDERTEFKVKAAYGLKGQGDFRDITFKKGEGFCWIVAESKEYCVIPDTANEPRYLHYKGRQKDDGVCIVIPMMFKRECIGILNFIKPYGQNFLEDEITFLVSVANLAATAIMNAYMHQKVVDLSISDTLTGTFNRRYLDRRLSEDVEQARRFKEPLSIIMIDIDHFKEFNDTGGHQTGDQVLTRVGNLLNSNTRRIDVVARFGGEEFCVILSKTGKEAAMDVAEKLRDSVERTNLITISAGVASFPEDSNDDRGLLIVADHALYKAKREGRNRVMSA